MTVSIESAVFYLFRISRLNESSCVNEHICELDCDCSHNADGNVARISIIRTILRAALFLQGFCNAFSFTLCTLPAGR